MYLLDTNVVSELRRARPHMGVIAWIERVPAPSLHVSAVTVGELQRGIEITRDHDPAKAAEFETWLKQIAESFDVLSMGADEFRRWAQFTHRRTRDLSEDAMIAATADINDLTVVTRNVRDFELFGVRTLNPFARRDA
jgi:predicted nucleic acid-binding protein